jgi:twinkle protein
MLKQAEVYEVPNLYDISGSAHFFNKTDYGLCIYRLLKDDKTGFSNTVQIHVQKVKFKHLGECGMVELNYNYVNGRYENINNTVDDWDNSNWLINGSNSNISRDEDPLNEKINEYAPF